MLRGAIGAGLAGLGLIGGAAAVNYNDDGSAEVQITQDGKTRTVTIGGAGGPSYSCPPGVEDQLAPVDTRSGRIKLTIRDVRSELRRIDAQYPGSSAPRPVATRFNGLIKREQALVRAFNESIDAHNEILEEECTED